MMKLALLALALAACHRSAPAVTTPPPPPDNTVADDPVPVYAALFERGAVWTFNVEQLDSDFDETGEYVDDVDQMVLACRVVQVEKLGDVEVSEVACDDGWPSTGGREPLTNVWARSSRGLWSIGEWPDGAPVELDGEPMISNPPRSWDVTETDPESGEPVFETFVEGSGDHWCWTSRVVQGDSSWTEWCLGPDGPTEGNYGWAGAAEHSASFTRAD